MSAITTESLRKVYPPPSGLRKPTSGWSPFPPGDGGPRPSGEVVALDGLDLAVNAGEFVGLLGPNGAGKTTTIGILTTRVRATSGSASVAGAGRNADKLEAAIAPYRGRGQFEWRRSEPSLEDVFIDLMARSQDNFQ